jgi:hypothetical protein
MNSKQSAEKSKVHGSHPEAQAKTPKAGTPGTELSKAPQRGTDARTGHDKDGNAQQRGR